MAEIPEKGFFISGWCLGCWGGNLGTAPQQRVLLGLMRSRRAFPAHPEEHRCPDEALREGARESCTAETAHEWRRAVEEELVAEMGAAFLSNTRREASVHPPGCPVPTVWQLMKLARGDVKLESSPQKGTTLHLYFPKAVIVSS